MKRDILPAVCIAVALAVLIGCLTIPVTAQLPSDLIEIKPLPGPITLSGTTSDSAKAIDGLNVPLQRWNGWELQDLGHYASRRLLVDQDAEKPAGVPGGLLNFSGLQPKDLRKTSVGNVTGLENVTIINGTMLWF